MHVKQGSGSIRGLNSDFVYFYGIGQIARESAGPRIYDPALQQQVFLSIQPPRDGVYGPSPYPPFVAMFFALFTYLSFEAAYLLWLVVSLTLYLVGIGAVALTVFPHERLKQSLILCFALAFYPFLFGTLLNAQLSAVAVCAVGVAIRQESVGRMFQSGLALALLSYKPTLLLLLIPMLLVTRRFRAVLGFLCGTGVLMLAATGFAGMRIWPAYLQMLRNFGHAAGVGGVSRLQLWKYLDIGSSLAAMTGRETGIVKAGLVFAMVAVAAILAWLLGTADRGPAAQRLAWASTLTWTLLLNVYVPIYDSVLAVIAIVLTLGALRDSVMRIAEEWTIVLSVAVFAAAWKTEAFARIHGVQLLTIGLAILGCMQLLFLHRANREKASARRGSEASSADGYPVRAAGISL